MNWPDFIIGVIVGLQVAVSYDVCRLLLRRSVTPTEKPTWIA